VCNPWAQDGGLVLMLICTHTMIPAFGPLRCWRGDGRLQASDVTLESCEGLINGAFAVARHDSSNRRMTCLRPAADVLLLSLRWLHWGLRRAVSGSRGGTHSESAAQGLLSCHSAAASSACACSATASPSKSQKCGTTRARSWSWLPTPTLASLRPHCRAHAWLQASRSGALTLRTCACC